MLWPPRRYLPRRQALLFLTAILVPCGVLLALGLRMMDQERKLEVSRLAEDRRRALDRVQEFLSNLEKAKLEQMTRAAAREGAYERRPEDPVAFVGPIKDGNLLLPWENNPAARKFRDGLIAGTFAERIREAESLELVGHRYEEAAKRYRASRDGAGDPAQRRHETRHSRNSGTLDSGKPADCEGWAVNALLTLALVPVLVVEAWVSLASTQSRPEHQNYRLRSSRRACNSARASRSFGRPAARLS